MEKNTILQIHIEDMTEQGEGIGKADGYPLFVKDTVIGDLAEVKVIKDKKTYGYGKLLRILEPSPDRVTPRCPVAGPCGGCQLQNLNYSAQLEFKRKKVANHLTRLGGFQQLEVNPVIGMEHPWEYRNKCQVPVGRGKDGQPVMGFYAGRTHSIIETEQCCLGDPVNEKILSLIREHMIRWKIEPYDEKSGKGLIRHILIRQGRKTGQIMVCLVINGQRISHAEQLVDELKKIPGLTSVSLNINREKNNTILGQKLIYLYGEEYITDRIGDIAFRISPLSFFQVNPVQTEKLYAKALEFAGLTGEETVWDLYCGAGTISLFLAQHAKQVYGVEIVPSAVENARENARQNHITNAQFFLGKSEEVLPEHYDQIYRETGKHLQADVIVVDPPRKGCERQLLETMLAMSPQRIVYVSCDSATLARDLKILCSDGNYEIKAVQPVDMFPQTVHIETVCLLSKLSEAKQHISVQVDMGEMDVTAAESKATYQEIQEWVQKKYGFHVSYLNIAKTKRKYGIIERQNYNLPKSENSRSPETPKEKEKAIIEAFKAFQMI